MGVAGGKGRVIPPGSPLISGHKAAAGPFVSVTGRERSVDSMNCPPLISVIREEERLGGWVGGGGGKERTLDFAEAMNGVHQGGETVAKRAEGDDSRNHFAAVVPGPASQIPSFKLLCALRINRQAA